MRVTSPIYLVRGSVSPLFMAIRLLYCGFNFGDSFLVVIKLKAVKHYSASFAGKSRGLFTGQFNFSRTQGTCLLAILFNIILHLFVLNLFCM